MMKPIFIGGTGRSGTTAMKQALAKHSAIASIPVELRFVVDPGGLLDLSQTMVSAWTPQAADIAIQRFERLVTDLAGPRKLSTLDRLTGWTKAARTRYPTLNLRHHFSPDRFNEAFQQFSREIAPIRTVGKWAGTETRSSKAQLVHAGPKSREEMQSLAANLLSGLFRGEEREFWIDDTPFSFLRAHEIFDLFPNARLLHIYRHPMDVFASHLKHTWAGNTPLAIARRISDTLDYWENVKSTPGLKLENILETSLERIVEAPGAELTKVIDFLGLSQEHAEDIFAVFKTGNAHIGRWKQELDQETINECLPVLQSHIVSLGYEDDTQAG